MVPFADSRQPKANGEKSDDNRQTFQDIHNNLSSSLPIVSRMTCILCNWSGLQSLILLDHFLMK